jgi:hypothetical protein
MVVTRDAQVLIRLDKYRISRNKVAQCKGDETLVFLANPGEVGNTVMECEIIDLVGFEAFEMYEIYLGSLCGVVDCK